MPAGAWPPSSPSLATGPRRWAKTRGANDVTLTPAAARRLYIWALCVGVVAALLMTFFPPSIRRHSGEGGVLILFGAPTAKASSAGQLQWFLSCLGPVLLGVSFLLQLLAILAQPTKR
jgi:hypothetical protein